MLPKIFKKSIKKSLKNIFWYKNSWIVPPLVARWLIIRHAFCLFIGYWTKSMLVEVGWPCSLHLSIFSYTTNGPEKKIKKMKY